MSNSHQDINITDGKLVKGYVPFKERFEDLNV